MDLHLHFYILHTYSRPVENRKADSHCFQLAFSFVFLLWMIQLYQIDYCLLTQAARFSTLKTEAQSNSIQSTQACVSLLLIMLIHLCCASPFAGEALVETPSNVHHWMEIEHISIFFHVALDCLAICLGSIDVSPGWREWANVKVRYVEANLILAILSSVDYVFFQTLYCMLEDLRFMCIGNRCRCGLAGFGSFNHLFVSICFWLN